MLILLQKTFSQDRKVGSSFSMMNKKLMLKASYIIMYIKFEGSAQKGLAMYSK